MDVKDLIIEGKGLLYGVYEEDKIKELKNSIRIFMEKQNLSQSEGGLDSQFLYMVFTADTYPRSESLKVYQKYGSDLEKFQKIIFKKHFKGLSNMIDDLPYRVTIHFKSQKIEHIPCLFIKIICEPTILQKKRQFLGFEMKLNDFKISRIVETNRQFIENFFLAFNVEILEAPQTKGGYVKTKVIERLEILEFKEACNLLKEGYLKIKKGDTEDGLTNLRSVWEIFIADLVRKKEEKPHRQADFKKNLMILKEKGFLNVESFNIILKNIETLFGQYLSNGAVHKRKKVGFREASHLFYIFEENIDFLIDRCLFV